MRSALGYFAFAILSSALVWAAAKEWVLTDSANEVAPVISKPNASSPEASAANHSEVMSEAEWRYRSNQPKHWRYVMLRK